MKRYLTAEQIAAGVERVGREICDFYRGTPEDSPVLAVCALKGAVIFFADLTRQFDFPVEFDFIRASSYGSARRSEGVVKLQDDVKTSVQGRRVLIVEDVADTGSTLDALRRHYLELGARDVEIAVAFNKPARRKLDVQVRFSAFTIDDVFLVGYGLDDVERRRELRDLWYVEDAQ